MNLLCKLVSSNWLTIAVLAIPNESWFTSAGEAAHSVDANGISRANVIGSVALVDVRAVRAPVVVEEHLVPVDEILRCTYKSAGH